MAPEIILRKPYKGASVDIFACGVVLFIMVSGIPPFLRAEKSDNYFKHIMKKDYDLFWEAHERHQPYNPNGENFFSDEFRDLMNHLLAFNPSHRYTIDEIKEHPWFNGPLARINELQKNFSERKKTVDDELRTQRLSKKEEKLNQSSQNSSNSEMELESDASTSVGYKPYY